MGPDMTPWQMVVDLEREIALQRAARLAPLGSPPSRTPRLLRWLRRLTTTTAPVPAQTARRPVSERV